MSMNWSGKRCMFICATDYPVNEIKKGEIRIESEDIQDALRLETIFVDREI